MSTVPKELFDEVQGKLDTANQRIGELETQANQRIGVLETQANQRISVLETQANQRISVLETQLKQRETLHTVGKIRYMMEVLEETGRPQHINERAWKFQKTREDRWNIIFAIPSHELFPWLRTFLDCLRGCCAGKTKSQILNESQDIVKIIFDITDKKIHTYFQDMPVDMSVFKSSRIKCAIDCLNSLEPEIMAYCSVSTHTSSST